MKCKVQSAAFVCERVKKRYAEGVFSMIFYRF